MKFLSIVLLISFLTYLFADCVEHHPYGIPKQSDQILCKKGFSIGYNYSTKVPDWTSMILTGSQARKQLDRKGKNFKEDRKVEYKYRSTLADYKKSGYDRGHMVASASSDWDGRVHNESFLLTNIVPQKPGLNRQGWVSVETAGRGLSMRFGKVNIITGSIYNYGPREDAIKIGPRDVVVPTHFYKVIYAHDQQKMWAWLMPNSKVSKKAAYKYRVSVDQIEEIADIDLFIQLPKRLQDNLESQVMSLSK